MLNYFYKDDLLSRFIKNLLETTKIPKNQCVTDSDPIISNVTYWYNGNLIRANTPQQVIVSVNDTEVIKNYNKTIQDSYSYSSSTNFYDSDTHYYLGEYLRYFKSRTNIDLMKFYNCYNYEIIDDLLIKPDGSIIDSQSNNRYRILSVPIKFNTTYSIMYECQTPIYMRSAIYSKKNKLILKSTPVDYYFTHLDANGSFDIERTMQFNHPVRFRIDTSDVSLYHQQKNLKLFIQVPVNNYSSLTVLETDLLSESAETKELENLSLTRFNTGTSYAFSDRLIEYLLKNVICCDEDLTDNIKRIQEKLIKLPETQAYKTRLDTGVSVYGIWDDEISSSVLKLLTSTQSKLSSFDQDGNINRDLEEILSLKEGKVI